MSPRHSKKLVHARYSPLAAIVSISLLTGCSGSETAASTDPVAPTTEVASTPISPQVEQPLEFPGVPFSIAISTQAAAAKTPWTIDSPNVVTLDSVAEASFQKDFEEVGQTGGYASTVRTVLADGSAFGAQMDSAPTGEVSGLENYRMPVGVFTGNNFTPLSELAQTTSLPGSNPKDLYFEAGEASSNQNFVSWREISAGEVGQMPSLAAEDWRIMVWDQQKNTVSEMASAYLLLGTRFAPPTTWNIPPATDGDFVFYEASLPQSTVDNLAAGQVVPAVVDGANQETESPNLGQGGLSTDTNWVSAVLATPMDQPGVSLFLGLGSAPVTSGGSVFWVDTAGVVSSMSVTGGQGESAFGSARPLFQIQPAGEADAADAGSTEAGSPEPGAQQTCFPSTMGTSDDLLVVTVLCSPTLENSTSVNSTSESLADGQTAWMLVWSLAGSSNLSPATANQLSAIVDTGSDNAYPSVSGTMMAWGNGTGNGDARMFMWNVDDQPDGGDIFNTPKVVGEETGLAFPRLGGQNLALPQFTDEGTAFWKLFKTKSS